MKGKQVAFLLLIVLSTASCWVDPCNPDCGDSYDLYFRIVSKNTGDNLVYGPHKIFDRSQMKIFSTKGADTTFTEVRAMYGNPQSDSILYFYLPARFDTAYIRLSLTDIDTLNLSYGLTNGKCCTFTTIKALNYNNTGLVQTKDSIVVLRK